MGEVAQAPKGRYFFYGWYIVAVGFLGNTASVFSLSSTLGVFLQPMTQDLGVSRGVFSLLRSGEGIISAGLSPFIGSMVDRHGPRWLMTFGALAVGIGFLVLSQVELFWQFLCVRWIISIGDAFMAYMAINVAISRWFIRKRGRAIAFSSMGIGFAKIGMPIFAASLIAWFGWRPVWGVFGVLTLALVVGPAALLMRRRPEDMGLHPDGAAQPFYQPGPLKGEEPRATPRVRPLAEEVTWSRREVIRTRAFWLIVAALTIPNIGVAGLNLHIFPYVEEISGSSVVAATVLSIIASTQLIFPLIWGFLADRIEVRKALILKFLVQAAGLSLVVSTTHFAPLYLGFFLYGIGISGGMVLTDLLWAAYFGRLSLGTVRGLGLLMTHGFAAMGPPFFGFLYDASKSYFLPFTLLIISLAVSSVLCLGLRPPTKVNIENM